MADQHWLTLVKDLITTIAVVLGGGWAIWKWGYTEKQRERREMASPDGSLSVTVAALDETKVAVTLHALWRNRGPLPIQLCPEHSVVEAFKIDSPASVGHLELKAGNSVSLLVKTHASWDEYIMEPGTDSIMQEHFVLQANATYGFRWTICLKPGSMPGKHSASHLECRREIIIKTPGNSDKTA